MRTQAEWKVDTHIAFTTWATRWVRTRVLPDPAPATIRVGPSVVSTASRWASFSPASRSGEAASAPGSGDGSTGAVYEPAGHPRRRAVATAPARPRAYGVPVK